MVQLPNYWRMLIPLSLHDAHVNRMQGPLSPHRMASSGYADMCVSPVRSPTPSSLAPPPTPDDCGSASLVFDSSTFTMSHGCGPHFFSSGGDNGPSASPGSSPMSPLSSITTLSSCTQHTSVSLLTRNISISCNGKN
jgi:hypothetical protein